MEIVFIAGQSGAGKTTAAAALEDLGYYRVDNIPLSMVEGLVNQLRQSSFERICVVIGGYQLVSDKLDLRGFFHDLAAKGLQVRSIFVCADDDELVRRFKITRRAHPFDGELGNALHREKSAIYRWTEFFELVIDTSSISVHDLKERVVSIFNQDRRLHYLNISFVSFGFKYGIYKSADNVIDVRFLPNPYFIPDMRYQSGLDDQVYDYVLGHELTLAFVSQWREVFDNLFTWYAQEGKSYVTIAFGCTGGQHRSVSMARYWSDTYRQHTGYHVFTHHRDVRPAAENG
ncbi:RNase adapter RapZ [Desulfurispira natronophila]|uniref:UPF0042 nucleotide-binding protein n=1 Tax=Desulfurispira natronophila TaxID=682562 RepID=A0A7W8DHR8_9BACT|nr:RNase adapter RapZ [Desulfurispira natronophila]MBB5022770.1 UPF0042 nucleotide-binding protein [Desulfurispira natronophila]